MLLRMNKHGFIFFTAILLSIAVGAQLKLPALISDSMVLQRDRPVKVWGWSLNGTEVMVSFQKKIYRTRPDMAGKWEVQLPAMKAGGPYTMKIETASDKRSLHGIAIGDVWLCSGQSNMAFNMASAAAMFPDDIAQSANPDIREFHVAQAFSLAPKTDVQGRWAPATPANTGNFTAAGYYMVKALYEKYKVPMGILHSSWGGSSAEAWASTEGLKDFDNYLDKLNNLTDSNEIKATLARQKTLIDDWHKKVNENDKGWDWSNPVYDTSAWKTLNLPGYWEDQGAGNVDGAVWVRKEINLSKAMTAKDAVLELGIIDDIDNTFFNGTKVGEKNSKYQLRKYTVPASLLKEGKNVIVIRIVDTDGKGGFIPGKQYRLTTATGEIPLSGIWEYSKGYSAEPLPVSSFIQINQQPAVLFNAMIAPLVPYAIKGVAWYQGETNAGRGEEYQRLLPAMIADWRKRWDQGEFPFLIVQLANYKAVKNEPEESGWAELREAQLYTAQQVHNSGLVVAIDVGEAADVHPLDKKTVGTRLALAARKIAYADNKVVHSGPVYQSMKIQGNRIVLSFIHTGGGLVARGGELKRFAIAGRDGRFIWARARIEDDKVIVWNNTLNDPVAVRYAWADNPEGANLYNKEGLPASPFRTDKKPDDL